MELPVILTLIVPKYSAHLFMQGGGGYVKTLPYPATQSLLPSTFKQHLYHNLHSSFPPLQ